MDSLSQRQFVHSTKLILARCIREKGIELSPEGRAALNALTDDFSTWRANPTSRGTPLPSGALTPVAVGSTGSRAPSSGEGRPAPISEAAVDVAVVLSRGVSCGLTPVTPPRLAETPWEGKLVGLEVGANGSW